MAGTIQPSSIDNINSYVPQHISIGRKRHIIDCAKTTTWGKVSSPLYQNRSNNYKSSSEAIHSLSMFSISLYFTQRSTKTTKSTNTQRSKIWYLMHPMVVFVILWIMCCCLSEAFASRSTNSFFGRKVVCTTMGTWRGGESSTKDRSSTVTCVMQAPPKITSTTNNGEFNNNNNSESSNKKKSFIKYNGMQQIPANLERNGASTTAAFYRPKQERQMDQSIYNNDVIENSLDDNNDNSNISVHDVVTAAVYVAETKLPTEIGQFQLRAYRIPTTSTTGDVNTENLNTQQQQQQNEPCVIYSRTKPPFGNATHKAQHVPVRIHDQCLTSEVFGSQRCDCKEQLYLALQYISKHGGCIIYLQQEGRGIGLANKIAAYALQDIGFDTVDANLHLGFPEDNRVYGVVPSILDDMAIGSIQLMTNNPRKVERLERVGVKVERTLPMVVAKTNQYNYRYMETKQNRMNHLNLANLLSQDAPEITATAVPRNGLMMPRKSIAAQYINNGTEMSANAVQVSLMVDQDDNLEAISSDSDKYQEGVLARDDGYCFGKQSVIDAIDAVRRGEMVVVVDDMNRENEGDFIMAADQCTALDMAQIVRYSSGVVCIAMKGDRMDELQLPPMCVNNEDPKGTAFSVTVDATKEHGISTGISASDRATTVRLLANPSTTALDFHRPGHIFPLRARDGGVLERDGHTEAAVDLSRLAGHAEAGILCEIVSEDNPTEMMRLPELKRFAKRHGFVITSIVDLIQYRKETGL